MGGCERSRASAASGPLPPPGEVWLTAERLASAKIEVAPVTEQNIEDTVRMNGKVSFDDQRVAHVFSPVTGRVVKIHVGLGQRVKKGDPLATLQSPDIGSASSDLGKADAELIAAGHDFKRKKALYEATRPRRQTSSKRRTTSERRRRRRGAP